MADEISQDLTLAVITNPADLKDYQEVLLIVGPPLTIAPPVSPRCQFWIET